MAVAAPEMTIAEAAAEAGVSVHTLRYYERAGLLAPIERNRSGHRRFTAEDVEWVAVCTKLRATGMPIRRIREYAELVREGEGNEAARLALLEAHREDVRARLREVKRNLELIDYKIDLYRGKLDGSCS
ncbi:MAG TPA: MerR family transcriptional regulator [Solirubrobacterales bacterium]|jgi:DNA-binding transcriptional MerR regulator|nr:MerR family transcriptional regulator [Solirubrobacterales bacterium]